MAFTFITHLLENTPSSKESLLEVNTEDFLNVLLAGAGEETLREGELEGIPAKMTVGALIDMYENRMPPPKMLLAEMDEFHRRRMEMFRKNAKKDRIEKETGVRPENTGPRFDKVKKSDNPLSYKMSHTDNYEPSGKNFDDMSDEEKYYDPDYESPDWEEEEISNHPSFKQTLGRMDTKDQLAKNASRTVNRRNK